MADRAGVPREREDDLLGPDAGFRSRAAAAGAQVHRFQTRGPLTVDVEQYEVRLGGDPVELTPRQVELLALFLATPERVWTRAQLYAICWGAGTASRGVDVQLSRIRARLGIDMFRNVRERGWSLRTTG